MKMAAPNMTVWIKLLGTKNFRLRNLNFFSIGNREIIIVFIMN